MTKKRPLKVYDLKPGHCYFLVVDPTLVNPDSLRKVYKQFQAKGVHLFVTFVQDVEKAMKFLPNPSDRDILFVKPVEDETVAADTK